MTTHTQDRSNSSGKGLYVIGILLIILLTAIPLALVNSEFGGSDNVGADAIASLAPNYDSSWIKNVWTPPGGETEAMLFALQAVAGGVLIGYFFGYKRGQRKQAE